ncbi:MAG: hypothetical protein WKG07_50330 [Hymenobacter sp.]
MGETNRLEQVAAEAHAPASGKPPPHRPLRPGGAAQAADPGFLTTASRHRHHPARSSSPIHGRRHGRPLASSNPALGLLRQQVLP